MKQALITMLELQDAMNSKVNADWRSQGNAWYRAIWVECAELLDHYGWKWWKAQSPDTEQVVLELIDIWHFGMSISLEQHADQNYADIAEPFMLALQAPADSSLDFREAIEAFALNTLSTKSFDTRGFAQLLVLAELDFEQLFERYIAKNVLNLFRQDHGYKEGTYIKVWGEKEDNEHLMQIMSELDKSSLTKDAIYQALTQRYQALTV